MIKEVRKNLKKTVSVIRNRCVDVVAVQPHNSERSTKLLRYTSLATLLNQSFGFSPLLSGIASSNSSSSSSISLRYLSCSSFFVSSIISAVFSWPHQQSSLGLISSGSTISGSSSHSIFGGFPGSQTSSLQRGHPFGLGGSDL